MIQTFARKIFGTQNDRELKTIYPLVDQIRSLEQQIKPLTDDGLRAKTAEFRERISRGESLDSILPEAFAVMREAGSRALGQRHYDVQMIGGIVLHRGKIAEMRTGEGKTLVSTLPAYLNALSGKGVHIVTVNDYLAKRDSEWMGQVHRFLGLSVGIIVHGLSDRQRQANYRCDITYGTNSEFGFDYLRDNMKFSLADYVQRDLNFAVVDEVDSILIDEARTPLIISGPTEQSTELYYEIDRIVKNLVTETHFTIDEKAKSVALTEEGVNQLEKSLNLRNLYDPENIELVHHIGQALKAHAIFKKDVDYVVRDSEVFIVDEFTGRIMPGRRWSDGLHQAVEAKEGVPIENENQTLATITYQNFFRMYKKLSGMTGTADTEAAEFKKIYNLDVVVIPTNRPMVRQDHADLIYKSAAGKFKAIVDDVKRVHEQGQPILVGTVSVEKSELLSSLLHKERIPHNVLNAKQHEREAEIVAQAGRKGGVTIATNMAGRGTDILLGGNADFLAKQDIQRRGLNSEKEPTHADEITKIHTQYRSQCEKDREVVKALGGLYIIGTERHESRRIDNQLRGRAGRQGDPGASRFYLSLEDDLMRIFGSVRIAKYMEEDVPIEHSWVTRAIENAQKKVEAHNFDIRKHLLEYDDVMNQQRKVIYGLRRIALAGTDKLHSQEKPDERIAEEIRQTIRHQFMEMAKRLSQSLAEICFPHRDGWNLEAVHSHFHLATSLQRDFSQKDLVALRTIADVSRFFLNHIMSAYDEKEKELSPPVMSEFTQMIFLSALDHFWKEHLLAMDHLRDGIGLRGYGQKDPLIEYKKEGYAFFQSMFKLIDQDVVRKVFEIQLSRPEQIESLAPKPQQNIIMNDPAAIASAVGETALTDQGGPPSSPRPSAPTSSGLSTQLNFGDNSVGRNDPCPCGSGKKYKKCHGA